MRYISLVLILFLISCVSEHDEAVDEESNQNINSEIIDLAFLAKSGEVYLSNHVDEEIPEVAEFKSQLINAINGENPDELRSSFDAIKGIILNELEKYPSSDNGTDIVYSKDIVALIDAFIQNDSSSLREREVLINQLQVYFMLFYDKKIAELNTPHYDIEFITQKGNITYFGFTSNHLPSYVRIKYSNTEEFEIYENGFFGIDMNTFPATLDIICKTGNHSLWKPIEEEELRLLID